MMASEQVQRSGASACEAGARSASAKEPMSVELTETLYEHMRAYASGLFRAGERAGTLQPTAVVHEAFIRLVQNGTRQWNDRTHFFAAAARVMRAVLVDHARARRALKRQGGRERITLCIIAEDNSQQLLDILALHEALEKLERLDERQGRIVEMRFFAGMKVHEIGEVLGVSRRTVELEWRVARAWLDRELSGGGAGGAKHPGASDADG